MQKRFFGISKANDANIILSKRNGFLDFLKVLLIFIVVWSHCISALMGSKFIWSDNYFNITSTTFQMPFFIAVSGYFFYHSTKKHSGVKIIKNKLCTLLVPIFFWNTLFFICRTNFFAMLLNGNIPNDYFISLNASWFGDLWYLWCYLIISVGVCVINIIVKNELLRFFSYVAALVFFHTFYPAYNIGFMFPFFLIGYYFNMFQGKINTIKCKKLCLFVIALPYPLLRYLYKPEYSMYTLGCKFDFSRVNYCLYAYFIRFFAGLSGVALLLIVAYVIYHYFVINRKACGLCISYIGARTMQIYILHTFLVTSIIKRIIIMRNLDAFFTDNFFTLNFVYGLLLAVIIMTVCLVCTAIIERIPILKKFAFGLKCH